LSQTTLYPVSSREYPNLTDSERDNIEERFMRHPFDGINVPPTPARESRRNWLRTMFAALAGALGLRSAAQAVAPPIKVYTVPEPSPEPPTDAAGETGKVTKAIGEAGRLSTQARFEEGAASTRALNEEAATGALRENGRITTRALREEGARNVTKALNENGGPPVKTTLKDGEEGGGK
jgi:hypothetical protein